MGTLQAVFARRLEAEVGAERYALTIERNMTQPDSHICHSHDFCDANQIMLDAFEEVHGREANVGTDEDSAPDMDAMQAAWNAWKAANGAHTT